MSMDKVLEADKKPYVSPLVNIEEFRNKATTAETRLNEYFQVPAVFQFQKLHDSEDSTSALEENVSIEAIETDCRIAFKYFLNSKGIDLNDAEEVINYMDESLQDLLITHPIDHIYMAFPPKDSKLKIHSMFTEFTKQPDLRRKKNRYLSKGKYHNFRPGELRKGYPHPESPVAKDIVMIAHLITQKSWKLRSDKLSADVRFLVRGDMPLTKLRDKIFCRYDYFSNLQDYEDATKTEDYYLNRYPSSFIFIHDTFYIDKRNPNAKDISKSIRDFMKNKEEFGPAQTADMSEYKIKDLFLRLGQPYVFIHIGDCEHLLVFTDLRTLHPTDSQELEHYPIFLSDRTMGPKCAVCKIETPSFIVSESDRIPSHPTFMCTSCFNAFHYEGDNRIGTFRAFHYIDTSIFE